MIRNAFELHCKTLSPFRPAGAEHLAAGLSRHACAEAVGTLSFNITGLKSSLHGSKDFRSGKRVRDSKNPSALCQIVRNIYI